MFAEPSNEQISGMSTPSCGLVAKSTDSVERLGFIAVRYRAWMGEALALPFARDGRTPEIEMLRLLCGSFDMIEHLAEDFLIEREDSVPTRAGDLASSVMEQAVRMKRLVLQFGAAMGDRTVPSVEDLDLLCRACEAHGARLDEVLRRLAPQSSSQRFSA